MSTHKGSLVLFTSLMLALLFLPTVPALSGDSATYHVDGGLGATGALGAQSATYSVDLFSSGSLAGTFDPSVVYVCTGSCLSSAVAAGGGGGGSSISITLTMPLNTTYGNGTPPDLRFTVTGSAASYDVNYSLDGGANVSGGTVANGNASIIDLGVLSIGQHNVTLTAYNASAGLNATTPTVYFTIIPAACIPSADPATAPSQCALNLNVSSPFPWSLNLFNSSVVLGWRAYLSSTGAVLSDACVNASFEGTTVFTDQDSVGSSTVLLGVNGTPKLTVTAYRNGCAPVSRDVYLYVRRPPVGVSGFPDLPWYLAPLLALAAVGVLHRNRLKR